MNHQLSNVDQRLLARLMWVELLYMSLGLRISLHMDTWL